MQPLEIKVDILYAQRQVDDCTRIDVRVVDADGGELKLFKQGVGQIGDPVDIVGAQFDHTFDSEAESSYYVQATDDSSNFDLEFVDDCETIEIEDELPPPAKEAVVGSETHIKVTGKNWPPGTPIRLVAHGVAAGRFPAEPFYLETVVPNDRGSFVETIAKTDRVRFAVCATYGDRVVWAHHPRK